MCDRWDWRQNCFEPWQQQPAQDNCHAELYGSLKVFVALEACDMREGFNGLHNGLHALVTERLGEDPRTGALFVFQQPKTQPLKDPPLLGWHGTLGDDQM